MKLEMDKYNRNVFDVSFTPILKGFAIILMFFLHILSPGVLSRPEKIVDFTINGQYLSSYLALSGNICIGIFAFITGYGWAGNFDQKTYAERIYRPHGGVYYLFYVAMFLFCFPVRGICWYIETGELLKISLKDAIFGLTAYHSESVFYGWYVYFYAMAVLTYKLFKALFDRVHLKNDILNILFILAVFLTGRIFSRIIFRNLFHYDICTSVSSHYFQWMPVVMLGTYTYQYSLFEKIDRILFSKPYYEKAQHTSNWRKTLAGVFIFLGLFCAKSLFQGITGNYSNFDSFIIIPFMYALILIAKGLYSKLIGKAIAFIGTLSTFMWFAHCVLRYEPFNGWLCMLRFPIFILIAGIIVMMPISYLLLKASQLLVQKG